MLGLAFCPGMDTDDERTHRHGGKVHRRSLDADLAEIKRWGAVSVVTLIEDFEFRRLAVRPLGASVEALGMRWHHLPIQDQWTPDWTFEALWDTAGTEVRATLRDGGKVLIHCRHGHGRTGMLAARLLIEFGDDAETAIRKVRAVRPKCIGTGEQETHVREYVAWKGEAGGQLEDVNAPETFEDGAGLLTLRALKVRQQLQDVRDRTQALSKPPSPILASPPLPPEREAAADECSGQKSVAEPVSAADETATEELASNPQPDKPSVRSTEEGGTGDQKIVTTKSTFSGTSAKDWIQRLEEMGLGESQSCLALKHALASPQKGNSAVVPGVSGGTWRKLPTEEPSSPAVPPAAEAGSSGKAEPETKREYSGTGISDMLERLEELGKGDGDYANALRIAVAEAHLGIGGGNSVVSCRFPWPDTSALKPVLAAKPQRENYPNDEAFETAFDQFRHRVRVTLDEVWRVYRLKS